MFENIYHNEFHLAIIVRNEYNKDGITFFTQNDLSQQLAYMSHKKGKIIQAHIHLPVERSVLYTQEVLVIKKGVLKVNFYDKNTNFIDSRLLYPLDVILLLSCGHGFEVIEDVDMYEIKQGPYAGDLDKHKF